MNVHTCKICESKHIELIEGWRFKDRLSYRQLKDKIEKETDIKISLGTITKHFQFATDDIAQAVDSQIKEFVKTEAINSMDVAVGNIKLAGRIIGQLTDATGLLRRPDMISDVVSLMREQRQSAELILKYSGANDNGEGKATIKLVVDEP